MTVFLNGQFVPAEQAVVSVFDRSFLYGDGLFETILVRNGRPFRFEHHVARLQNGAAFLGIAMPFAAPAFHSFAVQLLRENRSVDGVLRLTLSRGVGRRGYSPRDASQPMTVMTLHPNPLHDPAPPPQWRLVTAPFRLTAHEAGARVKTGNKLPQILARADAEARGADEALLLNTEGQVVEGAGSNLFWIADGTVCTPPLESGILAGVTRAVVLEICQRRGMPTVEAGITPEALSGQDGVFLSLSTLGIVEALTLDGAAVRRSSLTSSLRDDYWRLVQQETG